jgi:hypothetical protein
MKKLLYSILILIFSSCQLFAQPGCPNVTVAPTNPICNGSCTTLSATLQGTVATTSYTVDSIPYTPFSYNTGIPILIGIDDLWSDTIQLPFCFDFFGTSYTKCIVGSNGCIGFNITNANTYNTWPIGADIPSTTPADMLNTIMGPWHDVDPSVAGQQFYELQGTAPCRRLVVSWYQIAMFQCNNLIATHQIVLYETTNIIEVYIENKPVCATWNGGAAIEGIQDATGTLAYVVPGRNFSDPVWTAANDAWRFTPAGAPQYTFGWYQGSTLISTSDTVTVCPASTTTYTAQLINNACGGPVTVTSQATVTVNPSPGLSTSSTPAVCNGNNGTASVSATGNPPFSYAWSTTPVQTTATAAGLSAGLYTVTVTNANGCTSTATAQVNSTSSMNVTASVTGPNPICIGQSTTIAANATGGTPPYSYSWTPSATLSSSTSASTTATPTSTTSYTVSITDSNNCVSVATVTVTVNPLPTVTTCGNPSICLGDLATLCVTGANTYTWSPATGLSATTGSSVTANPVVTTTYTIIGQSAALCSATASITVTVNPLPLVASPPAPSICSGGSVQICMSGAQSYHWQPQAGIIAISGPDSTCVTVSVNSSTTYTVTGFSLEGCSATTTVTVTVNPNPVPVITPLGPTVFCAGGSVDLQATPTGTYAWSNSASTQIINVSASGSFTVTVTDANGCIGVSAPVSVTVNPLPTPSISPVAPAFCQGDSAVLTAAGGTGFLWSTNSSSQSITVNSSGTYTVTVTDANGCNSSTSVNVTVNPLPPAVISPAGPVLICSNNPATLSVASGPGYTYQWYLNGNPIAGAVNSTYNAAVTGMYSVRVSDALGCTSLSTDVQVQQGVGPVVTIQGPPQIGCLAQNTIYIGYGPQSATLTAVSATAVSYLWSTGATTQSISVTTSGSYSVTAYDANGCPSDSTPESQITITVIDIRCGHGLKKILFCHVPPGNQSNPQTICIPATAVVAHLAHHPYDCIGPCSLYYQRLSDPDMNDIIDVVSIYPNPSNSTFIISTTMHVDETETMRVNVYDMTGRLVISQNIISEKTEIGAELSEGVYHVEIISGEESATYKIVKF